MALNTSTLNRLRGITAKVRAGDAVSNMDLVWAQKQAIHDDVAEADLRAAGQFIEGADQEDTTEI
tara:strand:+ start:658 stop:852 length:195 start_codon:yes stop_codon:yes gene_type:complete